jgi:hypothetical protein
MVLVRTILAMLIAASVALLPAAGFVPTADASGSDMSGADMSNMDMSGMDLSATAGMADCCPPAAIPCDKAPGDCGSMAVCALKCFTFSAAGVSATVFPIAVAVLAPPFVSGPFSAQAASPPFRPPRL